MSRTSAVPDLIDALVAHAAARPNLSSVIVSDGELISLDPGYRFMVGVARPDSLSPISVAQSDQSWVLATATGRDENGSVTCSVYGMSGGNELKIVRDEVFRIAGEIQSMLRENGAPSVRQSVPGLRSTSYTGQVLEQVLDEDGSYVLLTFRIEFTARI
ncbi:MAG: hypothetical protein HY829_10460 [Actinobacteria bacterium]|nr:hypothetical protein [Actinomycetota bacterium]